MVRITRRDLLATSGAAFAAGSFGVIRRAPAAEFTYKYGNNLPATHPLNMRAAGGGGARSSRKPTAGSRSRSSRTTSSAPTPTC